MKIESGQFWSTIDQKEFRVIDVVELGEHTWVHYINESTGVEYSCYKESFEARFQPISNRS